MGLSRRSKRCSQLILLCLAAHRSTLLPVDAFLIQGRHPSQITGAYTPSARSDTLFNENDELDVAPVSDRKPCFYRAIDGRWRPRIHLEDLRIGQNLTGKVVSELLDGKTGAKVYLECGVGRTDDEGDWKMVNGMLRIGGRGTKASVARKKATRLRRKEQVELYVSRIQLDNGRLEVCTTPEEVEKYQGEPKFSASTLQPKQELVGTVSRVASFGVFVDVGANREGLLHIRKVADLYGRYIDKETGLENAGLERGARIKVAVESNQMKRLALDFTEDVKEAAKVERQEEDQTESEALPITDGAVQDAVDMSEEEAAAWAAYAVSETADEYDDDDEVDQDEFDEDASIEDAFGLGSY